MGNLPEFFLIIIVIVIITFVNEGIYRKSNIKLDFHIRQIMYPDILHFHIRKFYLTNLVNTVEVQIQIINIVFQVFLDNRSKVTIKSCSNIICK